MYIRIGGHVSFLLVMLDLNSDAIRRYVFLIIYF